MLDPFEHPVGCSMLDLLEHPVGCSMLDPFEHPVGCNMLDPFALLDDIGQHCRKRLIGLNSSFKIIQHWSSDLLK